MKTSNITTQDFFEYLNSLNLFRWKITQTNSGFEAILSENSNPYIKDFTTVLKNEDGSWWVRLSNEDVFNQEITKGFFNAKKNICYKQKIQ